MVKLAQKTKAGKAKKKSIKKDAKSHLLHAIKINPEFFDAHYELGCMLMDEGDFKNAEKQFKKVVKLDENHADGYFKLALIAAEFKKNKTARKQF